MTVTIITDLGYGDSGKGSTTDYLARQGSTVVVRHNGGPQAGHNVVSDGQHHCFSQFGAGTLAGAKTFLSRFMLINPLNMMLEAEHLKELGHGDVWDRTYVDQDAMIITPLHVALNRALERARGAGRHGSCGQGVGVAMDQSLRNPELTIRVRDLTRPGLLRKLKDQRDWATSQPPLPWMRDIDLGLVVDGYRQWARLPQIVPGEALGRLMSVHHHTVFEGAQGVLLDEWRGFHPYTTWSTTTHDNALALIKETGGTWPITRLGVMRAYTTRHGAGPFVTEDPSLHYDEPHNTTGDWQGDFRQGHLDLVALRYAVKVCGGVDQVAVTHLDRAHAWMYCDRYWQSRYAGGGPTLDDIPVGEFQDLKFQASTTATLMAAAPDYYRGKHPGTVRLMCTTSELLEAITANVGPVGITSWGPTANDKKVMSNV